MLFLFLTGSAAHPPYDFLRPTNLKSSQFEHDKPNPKSAYLTVLLQSLHAQSRPQAPSTSAMRQLPHLLQLPLCQWHLSCPCRTLQPCHHPLRPPHWHSLDCLQVSHAMCLALCKGLCLYPIRANPRVGLVLNYCCLHRA